MSIEGKHWRAYIDGNMNGKISIVWIRKWYMLTTNCTMYYSTHAHLSNPTNENESDSLWYKEFFPVQVHQTQTIPEFFSHFTLNVNISSRITKLNCTSVAFIPGSFLYTGLPIFNCIISYWAFSYYLCTILTISFKRDGTNNIVQ